jgi:hypothetical protein
MKHIITPLAHVGERHRHAGLWLVAVVSRCSPQRRHFQWLYECPCLEIVPPGSPKT